MKKKIKDDEKVTGVGEWMVSYSDMITLLLCFFVLLYAMSDINAEKFQQAMSSFGKNNIIIQTSQFGINNMLGSGITEMPISFDSSINDLQSYEKVRSDLNTLANDFKTYFEENGLTDKLNVEQGDNYIKIIFEDILFAKGSASINPNLIYILDKIAYEIKKTDKLDIRIEGHTDIDPINTPIFKDNWYLSAARAISVGNYFIKEKNISPYIIGTEGFGEYRPIAPNDNEKNKSKNRRVEIKIMVNLN